VGAQLITRFRGKQADREGEGGRQGNPCLPSPLHPTLLSTTAKTLFRFRKKHGGGRKQIDPAVSVCSFLLPLLSEGERCLSPFGRVYNPLSNPLLSEREKIEYALSLP
jgi:hypothetical protein